MVAGLGKRPAKKKGDPVFVSSKQESTFWKSMMERYHGTGWCDLDEQEAEVAETERQLGDKMMKRSCL